MNYSIEKTGFLSANDQNLDVYFSALIPQLFFDAGLVLRKFTPPAMKLFKLTPEYLGKPILDLGKTFLLSGMMGKIKAVLGSGKPEKELLSA